MVYQFAKRMITGADPKCLAKFAWNFGVKGVRSVELYKSRLKRGEHFPPFLFISVINSCNLRCQGCWVDVEAPRKREGAGTVGDYHGFWSHAEVKAGDERLQVLTHPEYWPERAMSPHERIHRCIDGRAEHTRRFYAGHLATWDRPDIDWT